MIKKDGQVSRKTLNEDRIAICPHFGCPYLKKVKPLKFGVLGFRKYPKCSKHKIPLVFVDEFIGNFFHAVRACLYDRSSLPPEQLINVIKTRMPKELKAFLIGWLYCNPIGRGVKIVSNYMDSLSRGYMKSLSRKQRKSLTNERNPKKNYEKLRLGLKKIALEYANFLKELREKSDIIWNSKELRPLSVDGRNFLKTWLKGHLNEIQLSRGKKKTKSYMQDDPLRLLKEEYDKILQAGTCSSLLGISPDITTKGVSPFELFSSYYEFLKSGLCIELTKEEIKSLLEKNLDEIEEETERKNIGVRKLKSNNKVYKWDNIVNLKRIFKVFKCDIEIGKISKTIEDISKSTGIYLDRLKEFCEIDEVEKLKDKFSPNDFIKIGESIGYEKYVQVNNPHRKNEKIRIYFKRPYQYINKILNNKEFFDIYTKGLRYHKINKIIPIINIRWNKLVRKDLWSEIDAFISKKMKNFEGFSDLDKFEDLKQIVLKHLKSVYGAQLNSILTSKSCVRLIRGSIVMIYLHRLNNINERFGRNVLSGNDIAKKAGYKKEPHWANILKMNLGLSKDLPQTRFYTEINKIINVLGKENSIDACIRIIKYIDGKTDEDIKLKNMKIKEIKNYFLNLVNDVFYNYLSEESKIYENKHNISDKIIITTYLLKSEHLLKSRDIIKISGIGYNLLDVLSEFLGIYTDKDNINYLSKERICIRCKKRKGFKEFTYLKYRNSKKDQLSHLCRSCTGIKKRTDGFKKKILAMIYLKLKKEKGINRNEFLSMVDDIKKGKVNKFHLNLGCSYKISGQKCDVDLNLLPIYELHHKDPTRKNKSWSYLSDLKLSKILEILDNDGEVEFICGNDHSYETAATIRLYLKGILTTSLKEVHKFPAYNRATIEFAIKKRMILQKEYGEYCVGCGLGIDPYLAAMHFHHKVKILKLYSFTKHLRYIKDVEEIRDIMRRAPQVPYCLNCHQMKKVQYFEDYKRDIFSEFLDDGIVNELLKKDEITI